MSKNANFAFSEGGGGVKWHFENLKSRSEDLPRNANFFIGVRGKVALVSGWGNLVLFVN